MDPLSYRIEIYYVLREYAKSWNVERSRETPGKRKVTFFFLMTHFYEWKTAYCSYLSWENNIVLPLGGGKKKGGKEIFGGEKRIWKWRAIAQQVASSLQDHFSNPACSVQGSELDALHTIVHPTNAPSIIQHNCQSLFYRGARAEQSWWINYFSILQQVAFLPCEA